MKTKIWVLLAGLFLAVLPVAIAQSDGGFGPGPDAGFDRGFDREARFAERRLEAVVEYLDLSEAQAWEWQALAESQHEARRADREQLRTSHEALRELLDGGSADATRVGQMVIDLHAKHQDLKARHETDVEALKQILTPDQAEKLNALLAARAMGPRFGERGGRRGRHSRFHGKATDDTPPEEN